MPDPASRRAQALPTKEIIILGTDPVLSADHDRRIVAAFDSLSTATLVHPSALTAHMMDRRTQHPATLVAFNGSSRQTTHRVPLVLQIGARRLAVLAIICEELVHPLIIGLQDMSKANTYMAFTEGYAHVEVEGEDDYTQIHDSFEGLPVPSYEPETPEEFIVCHASAFASPEEAEDPAAADLSAMHPQTLAKLTALLDTFKHVVTDQLHKGGAADVPPAHVNLKPGTQPIRIPSYKVNPAKEDIIRAIIEDLVKDGLIRPHSGPWASPVLLVKKKDGAWRLCIDYRRLNEVIEDDAYSLPNIEQLLDVIAGSKVFSIMDLTSGFWQVALDDESASIAAFSANGRTYVPNALPFGLKVSPSVFQKRLNDVLHDFSAFCRVYVDDIIVYSKTYEEHLDHLRQILKRLDEKNLRIKGSKCLFAQTSLKYLGHIVSADGVRPNPETVDQVRNSPAPTDLKQLRAWLGLANYYRRFVRNFAGLAVPLTRLTRKNARFEWSDECAEAFDAIKRAVSEDAVLMYPDFNKQFYLDVDASNFAVGYVLSQLDNEGILRPVAFGSRQLNAAQCNYSATDREALGTREGIRHFSYYFEGSRMPLIVRTDHKALVDMYNSREWTPLTARWFNEILNAKIELKYRAGESNGNADAMSRYPIAAGAMVLADDDPPVSPEELNVVGDVHYVLSIDEKPVAPLPIPTTYDARVMCCSVALVKEKFPVSLEAKLFFDGRALTMCQWQDEDPDLCIVRQWLKTPSITLPKPFSRAAKIGKFAEDRFGVLRYAKGKKYRSRIVMPTALQPLILHEFHSSVLYGSHRGIANTQQNVANRFWWPTWKKDIEIFVSRCSACIRSKAKPKISYGQLRPIPPATALFQRIGIDLIGPLPMSTCGHTHILVIVDYYSRWVEAVPLKDTTSPVIAEALINNFVARYGCPEYVLTDQGSNLTGTFISDFYTILQANKLTTTAYHPQTNGLTERMNGIIKEALTKYSNEFRNNWVRALPWVLHAIRTKPMSGLGGLAPYQVLYGIAPRHPLDRMTSDDPLSDQKPFTSDLHKVVSRFRRRARDYVKLIDPVRQKKMKDQADKTRKPADFKPGDKVYLEKPPNAMGVGSLADKREGPFPIIAVDPATPELATINKDNDTAKKTHVSRLTLAPQPNPPFTPAAIVAKDQPIPKIVEPVTHPSQKARLVRKEDSDITNAWRSQLNIKKVRAEYFTIFDQLFALLPSRLAVQSSKSHRGEVFAQSIRHCIQHTLKNYLLDRMMKKMMRETEDVLKLCSATDATPLLKLISYWITNLPKNIGQFGTKIDSTTVKTSGTADATV